MGNPGVPGRGEVAGEPDGSGPPLALELGSRLAPLPSGPDGEVAIDGPAADGDPVADRDPVADGDPAAEPVSPGCLGGERAGPSARVATAMTAALEVIRTARRTPARRAREAAMQRAPYRGVTAATIRPWLNH